LNRPITSKEIQLAIKNSPIKASLGPHDFIDKFYQTFKKELTPIFLKLFQKVKEGGTVSNSFYKVSIILITN